MPYIILLMTSVLKISCSQIKQIKRAHTSALPIKYNRYAMLAFDTGNDN